MVMMLRWVGGVQLTTKVGVSLNRTTSRVASVSSSKFGGCAWSWCAGEGGATGVSRLGSLERRLGEMLASQSMGSSTVGM